MIRSVSFVIFGDPVPFARAGSFGKRRFTPPKQRDYMLAVRAVAHAAMGGEPPFDGPLLMQVVAIYETPASWSRKRATATFWKQSRPDADNLAKSVADSIGTSDALAATDKLPATIVYNDDQQIVQLRVEKHYGKKACVIVRVEQLPEVTSE